MFCENIYELKTKCFINKYFLQILIIQNYEYEIPYVRLN